MSVILVTGSSTGIGQETALHMARKRHKVFASLRNPDAAEDLRASIAQERLDIDILRLDLTDADSISTAVADILKSAGRIDVLVNNAGIGGGVSVEESAMDDVRQVFETNYFGQVRVIQAVLPTMREQRSGVIVTVSSMVARVPMGNHGHYAASKLAMEGLSEALAQEVAALNIRVALIEPGVVLTPIWDKAVAPPVGHYGHSMARLGRFFKNALQQPATSAEVAHVIADAIESDSPRFRYPVGVDATQLINAREKISDEEWMRAICLPDGEFQQRMAELIGADYYRE